MGQATRTTKLPLDLDTRNVGGANTGKRASLQATIEVLNRARAFYVDFFLAHADKLAERVSYYSEKRQQLRERLISPNELLTWAESNTVATCEHPHPLPAYNFSERFPEFPFIYRRSVIKDAIGKVRSHLSNLARKRGNLDCQELAITPPSMTKHSAWTWTQRTSAPARAPASFASRSTRESAGNGSTLPSS